MGLQVTVSGEFTLSAGHIVTEADLLTINPPQKSIYDQVCAWLDKHPPPTVGFNHWAFAVGATALCLRWGTYLSVLMDKSKPVDPQAKQLTRSMISQTEMKRINIEASSNLARLLRLRHEDEAAYYDRLQRAYEWLPMPQLFVKRELKSFETVVRLLTGVYGLMLQDDFTAVTHPYRTLANTILNLTYRDGPIEDFHAGKGKTFPLDQRRFTARQARQVIQYTVESLSPFVTDLPLWSDDFTKLSPWPQN